MARIKRSLRRGQKSDTAQTDEPAAAAPGTSASIFNFFGLPREIRDQIYEDALDFKKSFPSQHGARMRGRRVVVPHLLQVNKQFHHEYMERAEKKTCLVIVDRNVYHGELLILPAPLSYARKLELHIALACDAPFHLDEGCRVLKEIRMHRKWIVDLCQQMRHLEALTVKVVVDPHKEVKGCEDKLLAASYRLTNLEELTRLEVYHCDYAPKMYGEWNFTRGRKLVMEWSAEDGELQQKVEEEAPVASDGSSELKAVSVEST